MKKKIFAALLAGTMVIGIAGCGSSSNGDNSSNSSEKENELTVWCWDATFNIPAVSEEAARV